MEHLPQCCPVRIPNLQRSIQLFEIEMNVCAVLFNIPLVDLVFLEPVLGLKLAIDDEQR